MQSADLTVGLPPSMRLPGSEDAIESLQREELLSWETDPNAGTVRFLSLVVGDAEMLGEIADELDVIHRYDFTRVDDETFYSYVEMDLRAADASFMGAFDIPGLVIVPPIIYTGRDRAHVTVLGESAAMARLLDRFPDDVEIDVQRVSEHQRRSETLAGRLTARQFEALEIARDAGYFDVPRTGSLAAVADELGCSESAASTLLRSAERALVDAAIAR